MAGNEVTMLDHNHPLFLQAGDAPALILIPIKLTGPENYALWSRAMNLALRGKGKLGFMDGNCVKIRYRGELVEQWKKCNAIVLSWIESTVSSEFMPSIVFASDAKKVWNDFQERFDRSDLTKIYYLWTEIATMRKGTDSVTTYFSNMKDFWDELDILAPLSSCDCEEVRPSIEHLKSQRLLQFWMGLNESYSNIRSNVLAKRPVVIMDEANAIVTQKESQRTLGVVDMNKEPLNLLAGKAQMVRPKTPRLVCEHCGYEGHLKENCYKIVGYPADFKSKKKLGQQSGVWQNNKNFKQGLFRGASQNNNGFRSYANNTTGERQVQGHFFAEEEYSQLMGLLNKSSQDGCSSNMACTVSLLSNTYTCEWIVDSDVSHHITLCIEMLQELRHIDKLHNSKVQVPTREGSHIANTGSTEILRKYRITNVLHALHSGKVMGIGRENNRLYFLRRGIKSPLGVAVIKNEDMATLWHLRLGHPSVGAMKHIPLLKNKVTDKIQEECMLLFGESVSRLQCTSSILTVVLDGKTPYELLYGEAPKLDHRVFVCLSYASNFPRSDKLAARAMLLRDVSFRETIFPFKTGKAYDDDLLFIPITDATGKVLQPELPEATNLPTEVHSSNHGDAQPEPAAPTNSPEVAETSDDTLEVQAEAEEETAPIQEPSTVDQPTDSGR
ncbi:PREDICTED: uncharacterized protein LOC109211022 [Nicotiana attenuata]|uniref:uncharacterized protein LOC109211022 n=1 Tax=Nicotiana attenuata TaxID=49451 RepID=UPI0009046AC8|nr:PREDICTED: uncharacterized protein LOC109211022 [Nicotiana attenuata]